MEDGNADISSEDEETKGKKKENPADVDPGINILGIEDIKKDDRKIVLNASENEKYSLVERPSWLF